MDDITLFGDSKAQLEDQRDALGEWLRVHRRLSWKDPAAEPVRADQSMVYLGYLVNRQGIGPGPVLRHRLRHETQRLGNNPQRFGQSVGSRAAAWMFGAPTGYRGEK